MDLSGFIGDIGYSLYYPFLFVLFIIALKNVNKLSYVILFYLIICILSVLYNNIPIYYNIVPRLFAYIMLIIGVSPLLNSKMLSVFRLRLLESFCLFTVGSVVLNFILFRGGGLSVEQIEIYNNNGLYFGTTANNEMAVLGSISIIYLSTLLIYKKNITKKVLLLIIFLLLIISILITLIASSRNVILCTLVALIAIIYVNYKNNIAKFLFVVLIILSITVVTSPLWLPYSRGIIEYKQHGELDRVDISSREVKWGTRIKEFKSSPIIGIGFGTISDPNSLTKSKGTIETGSGWLALFSQLGLLGAIPIIILTIYNLIYLLKRQSVNFHSTLLTGLTVIMIVQSLTEGYITNVGALLCVLFWLIQGSVYSLRKHVFELEIKKSNFHKN